MAPAASPHSLAGFRRIFAVVFSISDFPSIDGITGLSALYTQQPTRLLAKMRSRRKNTD